MKWFLTSLIVCLISGCSDQAQGDEKVAPGEQTTAASASSSSIANSDFRKSYIDGLDATMFLEFCNPGSSSTGSEVMARWWALTEEAHRQGLSGEIQTAQKSHEMIMATRRIATNCPEGLTDRIERTKPILDKLATVLKRLTEA